MEKLYKKCCEEKTVDTKASKIKAGHIFFIISCLLTVGCATQTVLDLIKTGISNETLAWAVATLGWGNSLLWYRTAAVLSSAKGKNPSHN